MPNPHDNIDQVIREALGQEDAALFDELGEQSPVAAILGSFRSQHRWFMFVSMFIGLLFMAFAVVCAVRFFRAEEVREMLINLAGFFFGLVSIMGMKIWYWLELHRNAISRELKRIELQVAALAAQDG